MPFLKKSLLDTRTLDVGQLLTVFCEADRLRDLWGRNDLPVERKPTRKKVIACVFFEPSTRTRMSFEIAAFRLGFQVTLLDSAADSSLSKGETYTDTILNVAAMRPDALVVRYGNSAELDALLPLLSLPVLNAGSGVASHPTQALLDSYTILKARGKMPGQKVLIVGDIRHSRVARSNADVLLKLGAEVAVCGPQSMLPSQEELEALSSNIKVFRNLDEGIQWATVYMGLRIQLERHGETAASQVSNSEFHRQFGLNQERLARLPQSTLILHPGPINHGLEFCSQVLTDSRSQVLTQVENGVLIRAALLSLILGATEDAEAKVGSK